MIEALKPADIRGFLAARASAGAGNATRARQLAALRAFLRFLARHHGIKPLAMAGCAGRSAWRRCRARSRRATRRRSAPRPGLVHDTPSAMRPAIPGGARHGAVHPALRLRLRISEALGLNVGDAPAWGG
jgi:integrase/recombinase XerC